MRAAVIFSVLALAVPVYLAGCTGGGTSQKGPAGQNDQDAQKDSGGHKDHGGQHYHGDHKDHAEGKMAGHRGEHKDHEAGGHQDNEPAPPGAVKVGDQVPDFSVRALDDKSVKLSELRRDERRTKSGIIVLSFWCSTCHSCRDVEHLLAKLAKDYEGQASVLVLAANADETPESVTAFLKKKGLDLPVVLAPGGNTADLFGVRRTTTTVVIDGNGVLRYCGQFRQKGGGSAEEALKAVLAGKEVAIKTTRQKG
jgi:thiol-disulfide isomerase/thioredoxin